MPDDRPPYRTADMEELAEKSAAKAVGLAFQILGIYVTDKDSIEEFRAGQVWVIRQMKAQEDRRAGFWRGATEKVGAAIVGAGMVLASYFWTHKS